MIRKSKKNENKPDFDDMMNEVEEELEIQQAEQKIIDRLSQLKQLSTDIDKATTAVINAKLSLESSIRQTQREEGLLGATMKTISKKVDTINAHIDNVLKDGPTKLNVAVHVCNADKKRLQELFDKERQRMLVQMQQHIREVNAMFVQERKRVRERYKEYDGCYLGHYAQWFVWFFFTIGISVVAGGMALLIARYYSS